MGRRAVLLALVAACLAWPSVAMGAQGQLTNCDPSPPAPTNNENCTMVYNGDGSEANDAVVTLADAGANYQVHDPNATIAPQSPCFNNGVDLTTMKCPTGDVARFSASLGDGNDRIAVNANLPSSIDGGGGDDAITGSPVNDQLQGSDGNDVVRGGDGNDRLSGGNGDDVFPAEAVGDGTDVVSGGPGTDTATYDQRTAPLQLSLDDVANDGFQGNATDNVQSDVENLVGGSAGDAISGSAANNALDGGGGDDSITGLAGDDTIAGGAGNDSEDGGEGTDQLSGGDGTDLGNYGNRTDALTITLDGNANDGAAGEGDNVQTDVENLLGGSGPDTLIGDPAANTFDGGAGENYEDGAAGADTLIGGASGDVLRTRGSAEGDVVNCGPGPDFVIAKPTDTIAADCDRADLGVNQKPKLRDSAVVTPVRGALQMSPTGIVRRVPLQDKVVLPLSSIVDTVAGAVKVTSSATARKVQTVALDSGAFDITQSAAKLAVTQFALVGGDFAICPAAPGGTTGAAAAAPKTVRTLWANGKGRFRTKGRYATAAIRGTRWQTVDRCDGTLVRVTAGAVTVRDLVKKTSVVVKAGHSYLAKAR